MHRKHTMMTKGDGGMERVLGPQKKNVVERKDGWWNKREAGEEKTGNRIRSY